MDPKTNKSEPMNAIEDAAFPLAPEAPLRKLKFRQLKAEWQGEEPVWNEVAQTFQVYKRPELDNTSYGDVWSKLAKEQGVEIEDMDLVKQNPHEVLKSPPMSVRSRFLHHQGDYFFKDRKNEPAFHDRGHAISSKSTDTAVIDAMLDMAQAKGWSTIRLRGEKEFMREAWYQAKLRGLDVEGYSPAIPDQARLTAELDRRKDKAAKAPQETVKVNRLAGIVLEHGIAPYQFDDKTKPSYFVSVLNIDGKASTHWGQDLERAVKESGVAIGDDITLAREKKKGAQTADWSITIKSEKQDLAALEIPTPPAAPVSDAKPDAPGANSRYIALLSDDTQALLQYPDLAAFYAARRSFEERALALYSDIPSQKAFMQAINKGLADKYQQGHVPKAPQENDRKQPLSSSGELQALAIGELARARGMNDEQVKEVVRKAQGVARKLESAGVIIKAPRIYDLAARPKKSVQSGGKSLARDLAQPKPSIRR